MTPPQRPNIALRIGLGIIGLVALAIIVPDRCAPWRPAPPAQPWTRTSLTETRSSTPPTCAAGERPVRIINPGEPEPIHICIAGR